MNTKLPSPDEIAGHYNRLLKDLDGEYIHQRWGDSEIKRRHYRQTELSLAKALEQVQRFGDVLEIGCGPAVWTTLFLANSRSVQLLDVSQEMLNEARNRLALWEGGAHADKVSYSQGDFLVAQLKPASFDTIVSARAFEYMSDKAEFVRKCYSLLRPGGTLVLATKNSGWYDSKQAYKRLADVPREEIAVGAAMQLDLMGWSQAVETLHKAGFLDIAAYPVIIGSYEFPMLSSTPGLAFADFLHKRYFRTPFGGFSTRLLDRLAESFVVVGRKA